MTIIGQCSYSINWCSFPVLFHVYREEDSEDRQLIDDTYECFNHLCQSWPGLEAMLAARSVSTFCEVVVSQGYGKL